MDKKQANKAIALVLGFISDSEYSEFFDISDYRINVLFFKKSLDMFDRVSPDRFLINFNRIKNVPSGHCNSERYAIGNSIHSFRVYVYENGMELCPFSIEDFNKWGSIEKERKEFDAEHY